MGVLISVVERSPRESDIQLTTVDALHSAHDESVSVLEGLVLRFGTHFQGEKLL